MKMEQDRNRRGCAVLCSGTSIVLRVHPLPGSPAPRCFWGSQLRETFGGMVSIVTGPGHCLVFVCPATSNVSNSERMNFVCVFSFFLRFLGPRFFFWSVCAIWNRWSHVDLFLLPSIFFSRRPKNRTSRFNRSPFAEHKGACWLPMLFTKLSAFVDGISA